MPGTFFGLEIARRGVNVHRATLNITGHNIANANTEGYSRQQAVIEASTPWTLPDLATKMQPGQLGTGVLSEQVRRIRDYHLDLQYREAGSNMGYWQKKLDVAQQIETLFPEPDGPGIQSTLLEFFNNWHDLNNDPQDPGVKAAVAEAGDELAAIIRHTHEQLSAIGKSISAAMEEQVKQVNDLLERIADVSNAIILTIKNDAQPNDLLDKRDILLDELASLTHIDVQAKDNGMITVYFMDGVATVLKDDGTGKVVASQVTLLTGVGTGGGENHLAVDGVDAINLTDLADYYTGAPPGAEKGAILGNESARLENKTLLEQLDHLAKAIIDNVNDRSGLSGLSGLPDLPDDLAFFTGAGAADMALHDYIKKNSEAIIGDKALSVAQLQSTPLPFGTGNLTIEEYYQSIVARVGAAVNGAGNMLDNQQAISQQIYSLKQSISGVSLDEELTLAIQFQYGYQASARMISMQDELLDYIINRM
jgi:flagellar hook-associated protein 1 FlgK